MHSHICSSVKGHLLEFLLFQIRRTSLIFQPNGSHIRGHETASHIAASPTISLLELQHIHLKSSPSDSKVISITIITQAKFFQERLIYINYWVCIPNIVQVSSSYTTRFFCCILSAELTDCVKLLNWLHVFVDQSHCSPAFALMS